MRRRLAFPMALALAGCAGPQPAPDAAPPVSSSVQAGLRWEERVSGAGVALTLFAPTGDSLLRLACVRDPAAMTVLVDGFRPVASEERLSLGFDDEPFVFVADLRSDRPSGVEASAPIDAAILARLEAAREVRAVYGTQTLGPHIPPEPELARRFAAACRQIAAR